MFRLLISELKVIIKGKFILLNVLTFDVCDSLFVIIEIYLRIRFSSNYVFKKDNVLVEMNMLFSFYSNLKLNLTLL